MGAFESQLAALSDCRCCDSGEEEALPITSYKTDGYDEEVMDRQVSFPLLLSQKPRSLSENMKGSYGGSPKSVRMAPCDSEDTPRNGRQRTETGHSCVSMNSCVSTTSLRSGSAAGLTFDLVQGEYVYSAEQMAKLASVQPNGSLVVTGIFMPLRITMDGHPGVLPGDTIEEVVSSTYDLPEDDVLQALFMALELGGSVTVLVSTRPHEFDINLFCEGESWYSLGVLVTIEREFADRIKVQAISDRGLVPEYNSENPACQVMPGDWIVHVNGEAKSAQEMAKAIQECTRSDNIWLGIEAQPRVMRGVMNPINVQLSPKKEKRMPLKDRAKTTEWTEMRTSLPRVPKPH